MFILEDLLNRSTAQNSLDQFKKNKVYVVVEPYDDGGAAGDFIKEIFYNKEDAQKYIDEEWYRYDHEIREWEIK